MNLPNELIEYIMSICLHNADPRPLRDYFNPSRHHIIRQIRILSQVCDLWYILTESSDILWKIVYDMIELPYKSISWKTPDYKELTKSRFYTCHMNQWFLRLQFIHFISDNSVVVSHDAKCFCSELIQKFSEYSKRITKISRASLPRSWDNINFLPSDKKQKINILSTICNHVCYTPHLHYVGWNWPIHYDNNTVIHGLTFC